MTSRRPHSEQVLQACTSLLACLLACQKPGQASAVDGAILGDQQFVTLLLYLDDICIFAPDVSAMLDQIELVFSWLKSFNFKIKLKKCYFFPG